MAEIDHGFTTELVCPYCGAKELDSWEVESGEEDLGRIDCGRCERTFTATRNISITYSTEKIDWKKEWKHYNQNITWQRDGIRELKKAVA